MKYVVKSIIYVFIAIILPGYLVAQDNNESVTLNASATVLSGLTITNETDVRFGNISATTSGTVHLSPNGSESSFVGRDALIGKLVIDGQPSSGILISFPEGVILADGGNSLFYHMSVFGNSIDDQLTSSAIASEGNGAVDMLRNLSTYVEGDGVNPEIPGGKFFLYVGGSLGGSEFGVPAALNNQPTGEYSGNVVFEVKYN